MRSQTRRSQDNRNRFQSDWRMIFADKSTRSAFNFESSRIWAGWVQWNPKSDIPNFGADEFDAQIENLKLKICFDWNCNETDSVAKFSLDQKLASPINICESPFRLLLSKHSNPACQTGHCLDCELLNAGFWFESRNSCKLDCHYRIIELEV